MHNIREYTRLYCEYIVLHFHMWVSVWTRCRARWWIVCIICVKSCRLLIVISKAIDFIYSRCAHSHSSYNRVVLNERLFPLSKAHRFAVCKFKQIFEYVRHAPRKDVNAQCLYTFKPVLSCQSSRVARSANIYRVNNCTDFLSLKCSRKPCTYII